MFRIRPQGIAEIQDQISEGMMVGAAEIEKRARANLAPYRDTGASADSLHVVTDRVNAWPKPVVFVATASGDGFFIHEGTVDTPRRPFLAKALNSTIREIPGFIKRGRRLGKVGKRTRSFNQINREYSEFDIRRTE